MTTDKISWTELRHAIAVRLGTSEREVAPFMNALTDQVILALKTDQQVKIGGLGTFKLQVIAPRRSVNVVTGEAFTIEGYNKIVFAPEIGVRELIDNTAKPSAAVMDTTTPLRKLNAQAEEIVGLLSDLGQTPYAPTPQDEETPSEEEVQTIVEPVEEPVVEPVEEPVEEPQSEETTLPEPVVEPEPVVPVVTPEPTPIVEPTPIPSPTPITTTIPQPAPASPFTTYTAETQTNEDEEDETKHHIGLWIFVILMLLLIGCVIYFYFHGDAKVWLGELKDRFARTEQVETQEQDTTTIQQDTTILVQETPEQPQREYTQTIATVHLREGQRLAQLARRYYGQTDYWVFIYEANRDVISNPHDISTGTALRIPKLSPELRDYTNPATIQLVNELKQQYK